MDINSYVEIENIIVDSQDDPRLFYRISKGFYNLSNTADGTVYGTTILMQYGNSKDWHMAIHEINFSIPVYIFEGDVDNVISALKLLSLNEL